MGTPLWWDTAGPATAGPATAGPDTPPSTRHAAPDVPAAADVVIVGGGFTGLWTAHYLLQARPSAQVVVLEAEHVGFGASGRNGGWVSALWPASPDSVAARHGRQAALDLLAALRDTVDEVGRATESLAVDCGFRKGGTVALARSPAQEARARAEVRHAQSWGVGTTWLDEAAARERLDATGTRGATYNPHCARVHPRRLVDGLASAVREAGAHVVEGVRVAAIEPGVARLEDGRAVRGTHVIRATEAWTATLPGQRRRVAPVYSLMVATAPLSPRQWDDIGLAAHEVFSDHRHVVVYGQRTVDDRLAFGGRGAPYHFGSRIEPRFDSEEAVFADLRATLRGMLPQLDGVSFTHAWGGPLGIARDWHPSVGLDPATGLGWAGGYVGDGVAATNLAGRTLADLVTGQDTPLTRLPWVGHRSRPWEPEPLRWLGVNAGLRLADAADREEARTGRPARLGRVLARLTAH